MNLPAELASLTGDEVELSAEHRTAIIKWLSERHSDQPELAKELAGRSDVYLAARVAAAVMIDRRAGRAEEREAARATTKEAEREASAKRQAAEQAAEESYRRSIARLNASRNGVAQ